MAVVKVEKVEKDPATQGWGECLSLVKVEVPGHIALELVKLCSCFLFASGFSNIQ